jgi:hypothetical protein
MNSLRSASTSSGFHLSILAQSSSNYLSVRSMRADHFIVMNKSVKNYNFNLSQPLMDNKQKL